jgi:hypothetical protein
MSDELRAGAASVPFGPQAGWARDTEAAIADGTAVTSVDGWIHAVRIGDGVIVTGPGETFTEIGIAVKERAPGRPSSTAATQTAT